MLRVAPLESALLVPEPVGPRMRCSRSWSRKLRLSRLSSTTWILLVGVVSATPWVGILFELLRSYV